MEEKKFDLNSIIGFTLIFGILMWIMYQNKPDEKELKEKQKQEQAAKVAEQKVKTNDVAIAAVDTTVADSSQIKKLQATLGSFAYSATLPSAKGGTTTLENDVLKLVISNKGGYIVDATLKKFERFEKGSGKLVKLVDQNNAGLNLQLQTRDNRTLDTKSLFFEPTLTKSGDNQVLSMKLKTGANDYIEYVYTLKKDYMLDFVIRSQGMANALNTAKPVALQWDLKTYRNEKSVSYENRYADIRYEYEDGKNDYMGQGNDKTETLSNVSYIAFKQHFFTSILLTDKKFSKAELYSNNLVNDDKKDTVFTKQFRAQVPLAFSGGELSEKMNWYYGPTDYKLLKSYDRNIQDIVPLGWGIFGFINRHLFIPLFGVLTSLVLPGLAIILFTILVRIVMSPVTYKSYVSQAKMKVLRPDINALNEKYKNDAMKKQQETMKLYNQAGVNPMAGCLPALVQIPVFYALFQLFPSAIELRQKSFLWANDLSSFDAVVKLPFTIPAYGNHISVFPILAAIAIFFYMKMTTGDQPVAAPTQEGMPDMSKIMKVMIYISPLMMLVFFNNYASGLSLYYFISNTITIAIMLVIKNYIVDNDKIHAIIQSNKQREPKQMGKFQRKMQDMMEQAEAQKKISKK